MYGSVIIPHSRLKNDKMLEIIKSLHRPESYIHRYNFAWIDDFLEEGKAIDFKKLVRKDIIKKALEYKDPDTDLLIVQNNFCYEIEITKNNIEFRILNRDSKASNDDRKIYSKYIDRIKFSENIRKFSLDVDSSISCVELTNEEHFMFSLNYKSKSMEVIKYILDLKRYLNEDEKFIYQVIIQPVNNDWWESAAEGHKKLKEDTMVKKLDISPKAVVGFTADVVLKCAVGAYQTIEEMVYGNVNKVDMCKDEVAVFKRDRGLSKETKDKVGECGFETAIRGICYAKTDERRRFLLSQFGNCFSCLDGDNTLLMKYIKMNKYNKDRIKNRELFIKPIQSMKMILCARELEPLMQLPVSQVQRELNMSRLDYNETRLNKELSDGYIPIGRAYGSKNTAYWSRIKDILTLSKCVVGIKGSGKSVYTEKYVYNAHKGGDCVIYFDYIENNLNSYNVMKRLNKDDYIVLDLSKGFTFAYPELDITNIPHDDEYVREVKRIASEYSKLIRTFIDTINIGDAQPLTSNMQNILDATSSMCFVSGNNEIYSIYKCLTDYKFRHEVIDKVKEMNIYNSDDFRYATLLSLDEKVEKKGKIVGYETNSKADRVLDRFSALLRDSRTEEMLVGINRNNINFVDMFEQNKVIFVLMPEDYFSDYELKDIVMTYFLSRIRLSALKRAAIIKDREERKVVHCILDEIHQLDNALSLMTKFLSEDRKFRISFYFTCQYLKQFRGLWDSIKGSGCHFMLLSGTEKENFNMLKEEIGSEFEIDELITMPKYHSLNIVRGKEKNLNIFISKME